MLGLVGILRGGMRLTPPAAVRGNWIVETDLTRWHGMPCDATAADAPQPLLSIVQSGRDLIITLNNAEKTVLAGTINPSSLLSANSVGSEKAKAASHAAAGCPDPHSLRLDARLNNQENEGSLSGTISFDDCSSCSPLAFSAVRKEADGRSAR